MRLAGKSWAGEVRNVSLLGAIGVTTEDHREILVNPFPLTKAAEAGELANAMAKASDKARAIGTTLSVRLRMHDQGSNLSRQ